MAQGTNHNVSPALSQLQKFGTFYKQMRSIIWLYSAVIFIGEVPVSAGIVPDKERFV